MLPAPAAICGARYEGPDHERCRGEDSHPGLVHPIDGATQKKLYDAVVENVVLVIRGQEHLTPRQLQAAGEMFG